MKNDMDLFTFYQGLWMCDMFLVLCGWNPEPTIVINAVFIGILI